MQRVQIKENTIIPSPNIPFTICGNWSLRLKSFTWIFSRCWGLALLLSGEDTDSSPPWSMWKLLSSFPETIWKEKGGPFWGVSLSVTSSCRIPLPTASTSYQPKNHTINQIPNTLKMQHRFEVDSTCQGEQRSLTMIIKKNEKGDLLVENQIYFNLQKTCTDTTQNFKYNKTLCCQTFAADKPV